MARIAYAFHIDPAEVARADPAEWHLRLASLNIIQADLEKEKART